MRGTVDDVVIVGGGDVGLLTGLAIRRTNPEVDVSVVDDFDREIPQVGKSTYLDIQQILHGSLGIPEPRFISEVKPIWKASVYFRDWCDCPEFHYPFDASDSFLGPDTSDTVEHFDYHYEELYENPDHLTRCEEIVAQGKSPWYYDATGDLGKYEKFAYHLDTQRFNAFLRTLCRERGVSLVDDEITTVETTGPRIDEVRSERQRYEADLYVDATGFNRALRREQDVDFRDFEFPLDAAFNVRVDRSLADVVPATVIETGDYGWFWQIDTYDDRDLGYVFASEYVDDEAASAEFREFVADVAPDDASGPVVTDAEVDRYEFTSGYYDRAWVANCLAIGNAEGFVEPLQSTALTANASLAVQFGSLLSAHDRRVTDDVQTAYNDAVRDTWESIYDFVGVHYRYASGDTAFWETVSSMDVSPRVDRIVDLFDEHGFDWTVDSDEAGLSDLRVFSLPSFYTIMRNMGATSEFHETNDFEVSDEFVEAVEQYYRDTRDRVENYHLTANELYRGILDSAVQ